MERSEDQKAPQRHGELHDPKLPVVHGGSFVGQAQKQVHPAPIPELPRQE